MAFCSNCGAKLFEGVKFCSECGAAVIGNTQPAGQQSNGNTEPQKRRGGVLGSLSGALSAGIKVVTEKANQTVPSSREEEATRVPIPPLPQVPPIPTGASPDRTVRQQEYIGKVYKCPNCGNVIGAMEAVCGGCGYYLTDRADGLSVQRFQELLLEIDTKQYGLYDNNHKRSLKEVIGIGELEREQERKDAIEAMRLQEKLTLIKSYPVPNTVDQISEFILLSAASIDVKESRRGIWNKTGKGNTVSEAWLLKMQQVYQKAKILFPNDPAFKGIERIYIEKMQELKIPT